jgi:CSLREA domain-containing protein
VLQRFEERIIPIMFQKVFKPIVAALFAATLLAPAQAETFTVTKLADTNDGVCDADCSLREAITAANAATSDDIINFTSSVRGAIDLTLELPPLSTNIDLRGPGARLLTIRRSLAPGTPDFRILRLWAQVSLSGLTLANGRVADSDLDNWGGAIFVMDDGVLTIRNCLFTGNYAPWGGAIFTTQATVLIYNSTFSGNTANKAGGAIFNQTGSTHMLISHCTLSNNTANLYGGGAISNGMPLTIEHSTISDNESPDGGGIHNSNSITISHTILANVSSGNSGGNIEQRGYPSATINSLGYNLVSDDGSGLLTGPGDVINTNPKLGLLQNNGGPTPTRALLPDSPAINAGNPAFAPPPTTDQRGEGFARVRLGRIDIGAFEAQTAFLAVSNIARAIYEGSAAAPGSATFTITLSAPSDQTVTVTYLTSDGTGTVDSDYVAQSGTLTFAPGQTVKRVTVPFIGDSVAELNETFFLDIRTPANATIVKSRGSCYIRNDDGPSISIANAVTVNEGPAQGAPAGTTPQNFSVTLSVASTDTITVDWATANGTAGPADYVVANGRLTFAPGETQKTITVLVKGDTLVEPNETYRVRLTRGTFAVIADSVGVAYIRNDDSAPGAPAHAPSR